jgi:CRP-like cAMP-binding protein
VANVFVRDADSPAGARRDPVEFSKGTAIFHEGDPARHWFEVVSGIVRTCRFMANGHRQLTGFFYEGDVFGVDAIHYRESAEAVTDVALKRHPSTALNSAFEDSDRPRVLEKALESARQSIFLFGHRTAANRVAAFLISTAERSERANGVQLPMTRSDIADHLNLTLHTVSRTICDFERRGLIALHGPQNVRILNLEELRAIAGDIEDAAA